MKTVLTASATFFLLCISVQAADRIRIVIPGLSGQFMTFPLAHKKASLKKTTLTLRSSASPALPADWR
jgi:hypothetical protein